MTCYFSELWDRGGGTGAGLERDGQGSRSFISRFHPSKGGDSGAGEAGVVAVVGGSSVCPPPCLLPFIFVCRSHFALFLFLEAHS